MKRLYTYQWFYFSILFCLCVKKSHFLAMLTYGSVYGHCVMLTCTTLVALHCALFCC